LSERFAGSPLLRHWLFLAATGCTIAFLGYYFGTFDQVLLIPFLKKDVNPSLYPTDSFVILRAQHYSYFWLLFQPLYRLGVLEVAMFAVHGLATYATFWALWTLSEALFHNPLANLLAVAVFAFPHIGFAGFPVFEFSLLNRTFALPFLLWAITLYLRRRYLFAFLLVGLIYNLHVISANFVLAMFLFDGLLQIRTVGWRNVLLGAAAFVVGALPVLIWKLSDSPADFSLRPEWLDLVRRSVLLNVYELFAGYPQIVFGTLSGASALALFFVARRRAPSAQHDRTLTHFVYAVLLILAVQIVTTHWLPVTIVNQLQIIRVGVFALVFGYLCFANYLADVYTSRTTGRFDFSLLAVAAVASSFPVILVVVLALRRLMRSARWGSWVVAGALAAMYLGSVGLVLQYRLWRPGLHVFPEPTAWHAAQLWARDHTPTDAVFITPPYRWWFYEAEWRVLSERATVVTLSEFIDAAFLPQYVDIWKPRFEAVAPGALARFRGDIFENLEITRQAYYTNSADDFRRIARRYGASYLVVEKPHVYDLPLVYANEQFIIYDLISQIHEAMLYSRPRCTGGLTSTARTTIIPTTVLHGRADLPADRLPISTFAARAPQPGGFVFGTLTPISNSEEPCTKLTPAASCAPAMLNRPSPSRAGSTRAATTAA
jgi:hypothetical protein